MALGIIESHTVFLPHLKQQKEVEVILSEQHHSSHGSHEAHATPAHGDTNAIHAERARCARRVYKTFRTRISPVTK